MLRPPEPLPSRTMPLKPINDQPAQYFHEISWLAKRPLTWIPSGASLGAGVCVLVLVPFVGARDLAVLKVPYADCLSVGTVKVPSSAGASKPVLSSAVTLTASPFV